MTTSGKTALLQVFANCDLRITTRTYRADVKLSLCLVTDDLSRLSHFYEALLRIAPTGDDTYVEFRAGNDWVLALCTSQALEAVAPGAHAAGLNRSARIELEVDNADAEFEVIRDKVSEVVVPPTSWPWGTRAAWVRDPDGNLVSLYAVT